MKHVAAYVPGLHEGYYKFFDRYRGATLYILGTELIKQFDHLRKDIRALNPHVVAAAINAWNIFEDVQVLDLGGIKNINERRQSVIMPDEYESREVAAIHLSNCLVVFESVFLRWDMLKSKAEFSVEENAMVSSEHFDRTVMGIAEEESQKSIDWWRHIGGVIIKGNQVLMSAYNHPSTSSHYLHLFGDPRSNFKRGVMIELSLFQHAEAALIAQAACHGHKLKDTDLYVTTFPCPPCAKLVAEAGIRRVYFREGYSTLDSEDVLRSNKIEVIRVV
jgi:dCMP deaminase